MIKNRKLVFASLGTIFLGLLLMFALFMPHTAHAACASTSTTTGLTSSINVTSLRAVLVDPNNDTNKAVTSTWQTLMTAVNSLIILLLVVIAFSEILRININTYGFKKIMPTLILAVIAANFSFMLCRLMLDFSSVALTFFSANGKFNCAYMLPWPFSSAPGHQWSGFGGLFLGILVDLIALATACLFYALAFLMIMRNWVVYFLVAVAPLGMMTMVLPQTKTMFNQWIQNLFRWIFMPVVSIALVWLGAQFSDLVSPGSTGAVMGTVFMGVCLYFALTLPFKMGGPIAAAWGNLAKKTWGKTGGAATKWAYGTASKKVKEIAGNYASGMWDNTKTKIFDNKTLKALGIKPLRMTVRSKQYADRAREDITAREERMRGELYGPKGLGRNAKTRAREVLRRKINEGMKGEDVENYKNDIFNRFIDEGKSAKEGSAEFENFQKWRKMWEGSGMAQFRMATADVSEKAEKSRAFTMAVLGGRDQSIKNKVKRDAAQADWVGRMGKNLGWTPDQIKDFIKFYGNERKVAQVNEAFQSKAEKDALFRPAKTSQMVHTVTQLKKITDKLTGLETEIENDLGITLKEGFRDIVKGEKTLEQVMAANPRANPDDVKKRFDAYGGLHFRTEGLLKSSNLMLEGEELGKVSAGRRAQILGKAQSNFANLTTMIQRQVDKEGGVAPREIADQVEIVNGKVTDLHELENVENTRLIGIVNEKTSSRQKVYSELSGQEQNAVAYNGAHTQDRMSRRTALAHNHGEILADPTDSTGEEIDLQSYFNLEDRNTANARARRSTLSNAVQGPNIAKGEFSSLSEDKEFTNAKTIAEYWLRDDEQFFGKVYDGLFDRATGEVKSGVTPDRIAQAFSKHYFDKSTTTARNKLNAGIAAQMAN